MDEQVKIIEITTPVDRNLITELKAGDRVSLSGGILVFRDQVHRILCEIIKEESPLPFSLKDAVLYYCGPTPPRHGKPAGSAGPTTSSRMDRFTGPLLKQGLAVTIGKGNRSPEITSLLKQHRAVYMVAVGGTGALLAKKVTGSSVIAFPELGTEAARKFTVVEMPLIVGIDSKGGSAFVQARFRSSLK